MRLAILDDYLDSALSLADWQALRQPTPSGLPVEITVFNHHLGGEDDVAAQLEAFDIIVAMRERTPFPASLLAKLPKLKLLVTTGMRNLSIDMQAARGQGVDVCGTAMTGYAAAEHSWALLMGLAKQLVIADQTVKSGGWQAAWSQPLKNKTLALAGLGKLGAQAARYAHAFDMSVIAWSENLTAEHAEAHGAKRVDKDTLFREADYLLVHLVLSDRTRGLIGATELSLMKPTAYLVNTSRGPIVDEAALIDALNHKRIAGAGIDVFDVEPLPIDHPLRQMENVLLTGHTGYMVREGIANAYAESVEDVQHWLAGKPLRLLNA